MSDQHVVTFLDAALFQTCRADLRTLFVGWRIRQDRDIWYGIERITQHVGALVMESSMALYHEFADEVVVEPWGVYFEGAFGCHSIEVPLAADRNFTVGERALTRLSHEAYLQTTDRYVGHVYGQTTAAQAIN